MKHKIISLNKHFDELLECTEVWLGVVKNDQSFAKQSYGFDYREAFYNFADWDRMPSLADKRYLVDFLLIPNEPISNNPKEKSLLLHIKAIGLRVLAKMAVNNLIAPKELLEINEGILKRSLCLKSRSPCFTYPLKQMLKLGKSLVPKENTEVRAKYNDLLQQQQAAIHPKQLILINK